MHHAKDAGITPETIAELGSVIYGKSSGRQSEADITICDLTGTGVQDTAIAVYTFEQATELNFGKIIEEGFLSYQLSVFLNLKCEKYYAGL